MFGPGYGRFGHDQRVPGNWDSSFLYRIDVDSLAIDQVIGVVKIDLATKAVVGSVVTGARAHSLSAMTAQLSSSSTITPTPSARCARPT